VPHQRGTLSGALIPAGGLAALECGATKRVAAGDHLLVIARVLEVPYLAENGEPLIRFRGRYPPLSPGSSALFGPATPDPPATVSSLLLV
jgi:flavin reductase (DIM6/NTAB) family NADH-FMN oxidoreductase RutF